MTSRRDRLRSFLSDHGVPLTDHGTEETLNTLVSLVEAEVREERATLQGALAEAIGCLGGPFTSDDARDRTIDRLRKHLRGTP